VPGEPRPPLGGRFVGREGRLDAELLGGDVDRLVAGVAGGVAVDNAYGVAFHRTILYRLGLGKDGIEAMRSGSEPGDPAHAAVYAFARAVVLDRGAVDPAIIRRALATGLTPADRLELVAECAFASLVGLVDNLAGRIELDDFLRPRAWQQRSGSSPQPA
jgi:hypothetical protein